MVLGNAAVVLPRLSCGPGENEGVDGRLRTAESLEHHSFPPILQWNISCVLSWLRVPLRYFCSTSSFCPMEACLCQGDQLVHNALIL